MTIKNVARATTTEGKRALIIFDEDRKGTLPETICPTCDFPLCGKAVVFNQTFYCSLRCCVEDDDIERWA